MWCVWQERRIPQEERFLGVGRHFDKVNNRRHSFATNLQSVVTVTSPRFREATGHPVGETAVGVAPFPEFAALVAQVTQLSKQFGDRVERGKVRDQRRSSLVLQFGSPGGIFR